MSSLPADEWARQRELVVSQSLDECLAGDEEIGKMARQRELVVSQSLDECLACMRMGKAARTGG